MKRFLAPAVFALALAFAQHQALATIVFTATLTGDQEVPPVTTTASGSADLTLNDAQTRLEVLIELFGLDLDGLQTPDNADDDVIAAHIHRAPFGVNGPIIFGFISPNSDLNDDLVIDPVAGTIFSAWDLTEGLDTTLADELPNLFNEGLYINIHTNPFPAGEIRGQIRRVPEPGTFALFATLLAGLGLMRWGKSRNCQQAVL